MRTIILGLAVAALLVPQAMGEELQGAEANLAQGLGRLANRFTEKGYLLSFTFLNSNHVREQNEIVDWIQFLQTLLDSQDLGVRRGAFHAISDLLGAEWSFRWHDRVQYNCSEEPLSEDEVFDFEKMRMYTANWLKKNAK